MTAFKRTAALFLLVIVTVASSNGQTVSNDSSERIHFGDLIEIDELGGFDYDWRGRITPEGFLQDFSKISDQIYARCKSPEELAELVRVRYAKTLREPKVRVRILDRSGRPNAFLEGAIRQPMKLQIRRDVRLKELIVSGGGLTDRASGEITVIRPANLSCDSPAGGLSQTFKIRIADILAGNADADMKIVTGDIVTVEQVLPVYVIGGVSRPGKFDWREGSTVSRVIAAAGGVADRGVSGEVVIFRRQSGIGTPIPVDLTRITAGIAPDIEIRAYDIIDVPLRGQGKRSMPPVVEDPPEIADRRNLPTTIID